MVSRNFLEFLGIIVFFVILAINGGISSYPSTQAFYTLLTTLIILLVFTTFINFYVHIIKKQIFIRDGLLFSELSFLRKIEIASVILFWSFFYFIIGYTGLIILVKFNQFFVVLQGSLLILIMLFEFGSLITKIRRKEWLNFTKISISRLWGGS